MNRYRVERHDQEDGSITYEVWDYNPKTYRRMVETNDSPQEEGAWALKDVTMIVNSLNHMERSHE